MNFLIGDIGNTNIKICKINKNFKIINTYLFNTKSLDLEKEINKKFKNINKVVHTNVLFSSRSVYSRIVINWYEIGFVS